MNKTEYADNPFTKILLVTSAAISNDLMKREGFKLGENNYHLLSNKEKYVSTVQKIQGELSGVFDQINIVRLFIRRYPNKKFHEENGLNKLDYIRYHMEALSHKVSTILDIMKLMVNTVYQLNIPKQKCTWNALLMKLDKENESLKVIETYFNTFESIINHRHINTHRGIYNDTERDEIDVKYGFSLYEATKKMGIEPSEIIKSAYPEPLIDWRIKSYKRSRILLINDLEEIVNDQLRLFLTSLKSEFIEQLNRIK